MAQVKPGWTKEKLDSIAEPGITHIVYRKTDCPTRFIIVADFRGMRIEGESDYFNQDNGALDNLAWIVADAMREYLKFKRARIVKPV